MDFAPGPLSDNYPRYCTASGNLVHNIGTIEKQVAGVQISIAENITVRHNSIYQVPRAGINIGDGCFGGHLIEFNDVFNTVLETGDHGAFNSWGRDRYWRPERDIVDSIVAAKPGIELLDVRSPIVIRNNRFRCDHGWDIDLDDGSSNYLIYDNICLNGGLKLREGYQRVVTNNILVNNTFHPHVWLKNSRDVFMHNIVSTAYAPILMEHYGTTIDSNYFLSAKGLSAAQQLKLDITSMAGAVPFTDAAHGDYTINTASPAARIGFHNIMAEFGVTSAVLKRVAAQPEIPIFYSTDPSGITTQVEWLGAVFKNIDTPGERSAAGLKDNLGAMLVELPPRSQAAKAHLQKGDVIVKVGDFAIAGSYDLLPAYQSVKWMGSVQCIIIRNQQVQVIAVSFK
jgi:hypothetical protein